MRNFESFGFDGEFNGLKYGDRVVVKYRDSMYYNMKGTVSYVIRSGQNKGDFTVVLDNGKYLEFYYTNLKKIIDVICVPSGEVIFFYADDAEDLALSNAIRWNKKGGYYYCDDKDKWAIESWGI